MRPLDGPYLFGRVISTNANPLGVGGANLIYVYSARSEDKHSIPALLPTQLLIPPLMTNRLPWLRGYFELVENRPLTAADRLPQHCFQDSRGRYRDELGRPVAGAVDPVGEFGLHSYRTIDDAVSQALGIPLAPEDDAPKGRSRRL
jgi:hypothetical protein